MLVSWFALFFFFQAEDGIRDDLVTGVQTCALPIFQVSSGNSSIGTAGAPMPALLNKRSRRPNSFLVRANSALIDSGSLTSVGTESVLALPASFLVSSSLSARRPASTTA